MLKILEWSFFYFLCYMGYGYGWVLFLGSIYHIKTNKDEETRITSNDIKSSKISLSNLPSWVTFPDFDRVNWINTILEKMWIHMNFFATTFIKETIEQKIQDTLEKLQIKQLAGFEINQVDLGTTPLCVDGIKAYDTKYNSVKFDYQHTGVQLEYQHIVAVPALKLTISIPSYRWNTSR